MKVLSDYFGVFKNGELVLSIAVEFRRDIKQQQVGD
jgi:hypothetical protein